MQSVRTTAKDGNIPRWTLRLVICWGSFHVCFPCFFPQHCNFSCRVTGGCSALACHSTSSYPASIASPTARLSVPGCFCPLHRSGTSLSPSTTLVLVPHPHKLLVLPSLLLHAGEAEVQPAPSPCIAPCAPDHPLSPHSFCRRTHSRGGNRTRTGPPSPAAAARHAQPRQCCVSLRKDIHEHTGKHERHCPVLRPLLNIEMGFVSRE